MTSPAITIGPDASIVRAAILMVDEHVRRLPVTDGVGRLVGIVSRRDLLGVFRPPDEVVRAEILEDVFRKAVWAEPPQVEVEVRDGVVTLLGELERSGMVAIAEQLTRGVDGVVEVVNHMTHQVDEAEVRPLYAVPAKSPASEPADEPECAGGVHPD